MLPHENGKHKYRIYNVDTCVCTHLNNLQLQLAVFLQDHFKVQQKLDPSNNNSKKYY